MLMILQLNQPQLVHKKYFKVNHEIIDDYLHKVVLVDNVVDGILH